MTYGKALKRFLEHATDWQALPFFDYQSNPQEHSPAERVTRFLDEAEGDIWPKPAYLFRAFRLTPLDKVRVVILGQDPYHSPGAATGLAFSVPKDTPLPASLRNIFKELEQDLDIVNTSGDLRPWAKQGVLLLNTCLSVQAGKPGSHLGIGWQRLIEQVLELINEKAKPSVFLLWGNHSQAYQHLINCKKHTVLVAAHPSPLSANRGFFGCQHFSQANRILKKLGRKPIDWRT